MATPTSVVDKSTINRILVIKLRHIGDVLLSAPVFEHLSREFPGARIWAVVNSGTEDMLTGNPWIEEVLVFDRGIKNLPLVRRGVKEIEFLRKIRTMGFDLTVDLTGGDRPAIISFISGARYRIGVDPKGKGFPGKKHLYTHTRLIDHRSHTVLQNLSVLEAMGVRPSTVQVRISIPEEARQRVRALLHEKNKPVVHIHPTSRWFFKCWLSEYMAEVVGNLLGRGFQVVITSSAASPIAPRFGCPLAWMSGI